MDQSVPVVTGAPTSAPAVSAIQQISEGQISDGQIIVPTSAPVVVTRAPVVTGSPIGTGGPDVTTRIFTSVLDPPPPPCGKCYLAGATAPPTSDSLFSSLSASYVVFTAYSTTSEYLSSGVCMITSGSPIPVTTPYSILKPATVPDLVFHSSAASAFIDYLGFTTCIGGNDPLIPTTLISINGSLQTSSPSTLISINGSLQTSSPSTPVLLTSSVSTTPTAASTTSSTITTRPPLTKQEEISIGVAVPVAVTGLLALAFLLWRRFRRSSKAGTSKGEEDSAGDEQPYLQKKAELEAEENRKYELDARERRYELDGQSKIYEISTRPDERGMPSLAIRQELRGEEHSKELEAPHQLLKSGTT